MRFCKRVWSLLAAIVFVGGTLWAQSSSGSIAGVVEDESGAVIPGATVTVTNVDTGISRAVTSDGAGRYRVPGIIPGHYEVQAEATGFQTEVRKGLQLTVGSDMAINLTLKVGQVTEKTVVTAEAPIVETTTSTMAGLVDDKTIRDLPLNGRSFDQLISLESSAPAYRLQRTNVANGMMDVFSVNGARTRANTFLMDGTELVGAGIATSGPGGVLGKNMGVDAVQEFKVLTGNYSAAYGKRAGGVINIATRSGTNQIHGSGFEFLRNDNLDARNFFDQTPQPPEFRRNQFGGAVGGPIRKDQAFYFGNFEGLREGLGLTNLAIVPDDNGRRGLLPDRNNPGQFVNVGVAPEVRPFFSLFPPPNGRNFGDGTAESFSAPTQVSSQDFVLTRVDHKISDKDFLMGRYNFMRARRVSPEVNPYFGNFDSSHDNSISLEEKRIYATTLNSARFAFSRSRALNTSAPLIDVDPSLAFYPGAAAVGQISFTSATGASGLTAAGIGTSYDRHYIINQFEVSDQVFHQRGGHSLSMGVQVQKIQHNENYGSNKLGSFEFVDLASFLQGKARLFRSASPSGGGDATKAYRLTYFSTFV
ncbi:MAG: hypothetical protein A3J28_05315 [Acidobacteria bacterium RIFCSPLOWO2_12_FULL_60_22]|nr:MAG: hypothetical protein A3J28_05315 [Acidobacteria bacterium RIFCSPLOWO2_12_FULL_60_22]